MSRDQIVSDAIAKIAAGQAQVLSDAVGAAVDASALEQKASDGTLSQGDLDKAVADAVSAAVAPLNQQISDLSAKDALDMQAAVDAKAAGDKAVADVQSKLDALSAKEAPEASAIAGLQQAVASLQSVLATLASIASPAPAPVPPPPPAA